MFSRCHLADDVKSNQIKIKWEFKWHLHRVAISPLKSGSNWNLEMLVFEERGKPEYPEKNLSSREEKQQHWQRIALKCVPHVQHDYFSSFKVSYHCFLASSLPLLSSLLSFSGVVVAVVVVLNRESSLLNLPIDASISASIRNSCQVKTNITQAQAENASISTSARKRTIFCPWAWAYACFRPVSKMK